MSDPFAVFEGLVNGIIWGKSAGDFRLESPGVQKRYLDAMKRLGIEGGRLIFPTPNQGTTIGTYGTNNLVQVDGNAHFWRTREPCDGFLTVVNGAVGVAYMPADCHIVLLSGTRKGKAMLLALHCGWRGLVGGILEKGIKLLFELGINCTDLRALVTPGIGPCCFKVGDEVMDRFKKKFPDARLHSHTRDGNSQSINMSRVIREELIGSNIEKFVIMNGCTRCQKDVFWSHRRGDAERNIVAAALA